MNSFKVGRIFLITGVIYGIILSEINCSFLSKTIWRFKKSYQEWLNKKCNLCFECFEIGVSQNWFTSYSFKQNLIAKLIQLGTNKQIQSSVFKG